MTTFLNLIATEPEAARIPVMVDSSKWSVLRGRPEVRPGQRGSVNSISLKEGEEVLPPPRPRRSRATARAPWSWPSTSKGQADSVERKVAICGRAYDLLTRQAGFAAEDIIFDPNVLAVATGIAEHKRVREGLYRGAAADQGTLPRVSAPAAESPTCRSPSAATTPCAVPCTPRSFTTRSGPGSTWASSMPAQLDVYEDIKPRAQGARRGCPVRPARRRHRPARRVRRAG